MQAVILAAGQGKNLRPLTYHIPKPMIRLAGYNFIEWNLKNLPKEINEVVLVVGYLAEQIINHFGNEYNGIKIIYVKQKKQLGTGHALQICRSVLGDRFLVLMGDDIYSARDIDKCLKHNLCLLANEISGKFIGGRIKLNSAGHLQEIKEGVHNRNISMVNTGLYILTKDILNYNLESEKENYNLPQTIVKLAQNKPIVIEKAYFWLQVNDTATLKRAEKLLKRLNEK